jgi:two-component system sensor kinase FixL
VNSYHSVAISEHARVVEREFQAVLDALVDAVVIVDELGTIELVNHAAESMFGYREEEVVGRHLEVFMAEPFPPGGALAYYREVLASGKSRRPGREVMARRRDGSHFPADLAIGPVKDLEPPRFVGLIRDISVRKQAEEELRRSESQLQVAQELANLGNYIFHTDQGDVFGSRQLHRILGRPPGEALPGTEEFLATVVFPTDRARVGRAIEQLYADDRSLDIEYRIVLFDGSVRYIHHIAQRLRDESGKITREAGTIHDITDRRRAEDELRQMQDRLTHFGRISTMGEMAAGLAHEINQPLSAIATYAQACERFLKSENFERGEIIGALEQITNQALRAGEVIRRLRSFVKNREVRRECIEAHRLLSDVLTLAQTDARHNNVRLRLRSPRQSCSVHADEVQIQQVILNLVRNSIDAMLAVPEPSREIVLSTRMDAQGDVEFAVTDRGVGFDEAVAHEFFTPFFTTKPGGTGLGLPISRSIVRAHGGRLWCDANPGGGARFFFTLPAAPTANEGTE